MSIKNYIFQTQNAIFKTLKNANIGVEIIMNRGQVVAYPYVIIAGTKKKLLDNFQKELTAEIVVTTKDFSVISSANILEKIENAVHQKALQVNIEHYEIHFVEILNSSVYANEEGFFYGRVEVVVIID
ncbi:MAG: hypothetical protein ACI9CD_000888 [Candidatus Deianiraeaceae bacterium]|jgi:hypothetical protein